MPATQARLSSNRTGTSAFLRRHEAVQRPVEARHDPGHRVQQVEGQARDPRCRSPPAPAGTRRRRSGSPRTTRGARCSAGARRRGIARSAPRTRARAPPSAPAASRTRAATARARAGADRTPRRGCQRSGRPTAKSTRATPTAESGRISRANAIFFTRFALSSTARAPSHRGREQVPGEQSRQQVHGVVGRSPHPGPSPRTRRRRGRSGFSSDQLLRRRAVLHLELLADKIREDLAVGHDDTEPFARGGAATPGSLEGLPGRGHGLSAGVQDQPTLRDQLRMLSVDWRNPTSRSIASTTGGFGPTSWSGRRSARSRGRRA